MRRIKTGWVRCDKICLPIGRFDPYFVFYILGFLLFSWVIKTMPITLIKIFYSYFTILSSSHDTLNWVLTNKQQNIYLVLRKEIFRKHIFCDTKPFFFSVSYPFSVSVVPGIIVCVVKCVTIHIHQHFSSMHPHKLYCTEGNISCFTRTN